jgi:hypothetical protein
LRRRCRLVMTLQDSTLQDFWGYREMVVQWRRLAGHPVGCA